MTMMFRSGPTTVRPQPVTEQSLMESVAGCNHHHYHQHCHHHNHQWRHYPSSIWRKVFLLHCFNFSCVLFWPEFRNVFTDHNVPLNLNFTREEIFLQTENMDFHFFVENLSWLSSHSLHHPKTDNDKEYYGRHDYSDDVMINGYFVALAIPSSLYQPIPELFSHWPQWRGWNKCWQSQ